MKDIVVLAGPNGAGKTTAAQILLPRELGIFEFVNADEIARGISPFNPEGASLSAGRLMVKRMRELAHAGTSFAFETTCAGRGHVAFLKRFRAAGWRITLIYLWLPSPQSALDRVARRIKAGGHRIADDVVVRRYWTGLYNMRHYYLPLADVAAVYDNSDQGRTLIAERLPDCGLVIVDAERWSLIEKATS